MSGNKVRQESYCIGGDSATLLLIRLYGDLSVDVIEQALIVYWN